MNEMDEVRAELNWQAWLTLCHWVEFMALDGLIESPTESAMMEKLNRLRPNPPE